MISGLLKFTLMLLIATMMAACNRTVTNNVPGPISSTIIPQAPTLGGGATVDSGGVINGGGGKGVLCKKDGKQTVEVLDLYEAKSIYNLKLLDFGTSEDESKMKLARILANHFWNPYTVELDNYAKLLLQNYIQDLLNNIRFIDEGKKLRLTNDSFEPTLEEGCESVQVAYYYDESVLLIDKALWNQMDWTNRMGLIAHEALYFLARQSGTTNSINTRKLVGLLFSEKGIRPIYDGVPKNRDNFLDCQLSTAGFSKGHFFMYRGQNPEGEKGMELVFSDLANDGTRFRTSAFMKDLSFAQLQFPKYNGRRESSLTKDTYPVRDQIGLTFQGIIDGELRANLQVLRGAAGTVSDSLDVRCELPTSFDDLEPFKMIPAEFEQKESSGTIDRLSIDALGAVTLEETRQVGGPGGISKRGTVPYPTVCRYKRTGAITKRDDNEIQFETLYVEISSLEGLKDTAHCKDYVATFNRFASEDLIRFTIRLKEFTRVK